MEQETYTFIKNKMNLLFTIYLQTIIKQINHILFNVLSPSTIMRLKEKSHKTIEKKRNWKRKSSKRSEN